MLDLPPRPIGRGGFGWGANAGSGAWAAHARADFQEADHDVEADTVRTTRLRGPGREPGRRAAPQPALLARVDGLRAAALSLRPPALDLDEYEQRAAFHDQVDLDSIRSDVARDDAISSRLEEARGLRLSIAAERVTRQWTSARPSGIDASTIDPSTIDASTIERERRRI